jgi:cell division transport system permease protein
MANWWPPMAEPRSFRPRRADDLGLRRALSDRLLPLLVAAMSFLAALALAAALAASSLAGRWQDGAGATLTVQVPEPEASAGASTRANAVLAALSAMPGVSAAHRLSDQDFADLLRPWLGQDPAVLSLKLPALFEVRLTATADIGALETRLTQAAAGTLVERNGAWLLRLRALSLSLQACAAFLLVLVAGTAAAMVAIATRAGLAARREAIGIVHGLGATDGMIAGRFAGRIGALTLAGALLGVLAAAPVLLGLAHLAAPFSGDTPPAGQAPLAMLNSLPPALWLSLAALPVAAALIGWATAQATVRLWLARLA